MSESPYEAVVLSDLHMGDGWTFGILPTARHAGGADDPIVVRCTRAALAEIVAWGADLLIIKGDITHHGTDDTKKDGHQNAARRIARHEEFGEPSRNQPEHESSAIWRSVS